MDFTRVYEESKDRIVFHGDTASPGYWDSLWLQSLEPSSIRTRWYRSWVARYTKRFLPAGASILEGGCGIGSHVHAMQDAGYDAIGVDYAVNTVERVRQLAPEVDIRLGDVRNLDFPDDSLDGYWSLGVIEHFWGGYHDIMGEMARVIRPGGYLFLTFPAFSLLRRIKAKRGFYETRDVFDTSPEQFFQFAMRPEPVITDLENSGFVLLKRRLRDATHAISTEIDWAPGIRIPRAVAESVGYRLCRKAWRTATDCLLNRIAGHMCFLVLKRPAEASGT